MPPTAIIHRYWWRERQITGAPIAKCLVEKSFHCRIGKQLLSLKYAVAFVVEDHVADLLCPGFT